MLYPLAVVIAALLATGGARAATVTTADGLAITFADANGTITAVDAGGMPMSLIGGDVGGLSLSIGTRIAPFLVTSLDFNTDGGPWTSARNADWDGAGAYATWLPDGGPDDSGHLRLGDRSTLGAGMAMAAPAPIHANGRVRISWQARAASIETLQILCVRVYDAGGQDITPVSSPPAGWGWSSTSLAHGVWGLRCSQPDTWEAFEQVYTAPADAASIRVSLRYWNGGDRLVYIDDLRTDVIGGVTWSERVPVRGPITPTADGFHQTVALSEQDVSVELAVAATDECVRIGVELQADTPMTDDRPVVLHWTLPVDAVGATWWDDIDTSRAIDADTTLANTFPLAGRAVSRYPFGSITTADAGVALGVPMDDTGVQRIEYDPHDGLRSVWEMVLSPLTTKLGPGRATASLVIYHHGPAWGFRAAADKYYRVFPESFVKRTPRDGAWMYPIPPSQIPDPDDFGFAFFETQPRDAAERALCAQHGIGIYHYVEPWLAWQSYGDQSERPPYDDRVELLETWAAQTTPLATWYADGGLGDSGHVQLSDGQTTGAGLATTGRFAVVGGSSITIAWQARVSDASTMQILCVRLFDASGNDITPATPAPAGWFWSGTSAAHTIAGIANTETDAWQPFAYTYAVPAQAAAVRLSLRHWTGGDHLVHVDDLVVTGLGGTTVLALSFDADDGTWASAYNADWENAGGPNWLRARRWQTAQAVINSSPLDDARRYLIDSAYLWHEWSGGVWNQGWPVNSDPDVPSPNTYELYRDHWVMYRADETEGMYIDSLNASGAVGGWDSRRAEHFAYSDVPLAFSWTDGGALQLAVQTHEEFLRAIETELRAQGRLLMFNLFPTAMRFHAQHADIMGSEVFEFVESNADSRLRRTLARRRVVSDLLQWGWDVPEYATYEQMESFIRGQLFWGFFPAVSSAGGMLDGGTPDRYFLHPELYERDRPLFRRYMPVVRALSEAGWEPITAAAASPDAELERFGDFARGSVLLTVRGHDGAAVETTITVDLAEAGLPAGAAMDSAEDMLDAAPPSLTRLALPARVQLSVSLGAGEVGAYRLNSVPSVTADLDHDADVDLADFSAFLACFNGPNRPAAFSACGPVDLDADGDVDLADFAVFLGCFNGPNRTPACTG